MSILWASLSMALKDAILTCLTISEARGRAVLSGILDGLGDLAVILSTIYGAGFVLQHGWSTHAFLVVGAMVTTSVAGTILWTKLGQRLVGQEPLAAEIAVMKGRIDSLEHRMDHVAELERRMGIAE